MVTKSETVPESDLELLTDLLAPDELVLQPEVARWLLTIKFSDDQQARMVELADRGNQGVLTPDEREELHRFARVGTTLSLLHSKARLALRQPVRSG